MWTILRTAILAIILFLFSRLVPTQRVSRPTHLDCKDWHEEKARQSELGQARPALHRPHPGKLIRGNCSEAATVADQYVNSVQLKDWVRKNKDQKYVPSDLLKAWDFEAVSDF